MILEQPLGERFVHLALAQTDERVRADKSGFARRSCSPPCCGTRCWRRWKRAREARRARDPGAEPGDGRQCSTRRPTSSRSRGASTRDHARNLGTAAALRAALGQSRHRLAAAPALSRRLRFPAAARGRRRGATNSPTGGPAFRTANGKSATRCVEEAARSRRRRQRRRKPASAAARKGQHWPAEPGRRPRNRLGLSAFMCQRDNALHTSDSDRNQGEVARALNSAPGSLRSIAQTQLAAVSSLYRRRRSACGPDRFHQCRGAVVPRSSRYALLAAPARLELRSAASARAATSRHPVDLDLLLVDD